MNTVEVELFAIFYSVWVTKRKKEKNAKVYFCDYKTSQKTHFKSHRKNFYFYSIHNCIQSPSIVCMVLWCDRCLPCDCRWWVWVRECISTLEADSSACSKMEHLTNVSTGLHWRLEASPLIDSPWIFIVFSQLFSLHHLVFIRQQKLSCWDSWLSYNIFVIDGLSALSSSFATAVSLSGSQLEQSQFSAVHIKVLASDFCWCSACSDSSLAMEKYLNKLNSSHWLDYSRDVLICACVVCEYVNKDSKPLP